jgi:hypothetical protein
MVQAHPDKKCETPSQKKNKAKRAVGITQVIECLPSKCEALTSYPSTAQKNEKEGREKGRKEGRGRVGGRKEGNTVIKLIFFIFIIY